MNVVEACSAQLTSLPMWNNTVWCMGTGKLAYAYEFKKCLDFGVNTDYTSMLVKVGTCCSNITTFIYEGIYPHKLSIKNDLIPNADLSNRDLIINGLMEFNDCINVTLNSVIFTNYGTINMALNDCNFTVPKMKVNSFMTMCSGTVLNITNNRSLVDGAYIIAEKVINRQLPSYCGLGSIMYFDRALLLVKGDFNLDAGTTCEFLGFSLDAGRLVISSNETIVDANL